MLGLNDQDLYEAAGDGGLPLTAEVAKRYAEGWERSPRAELINRIKSISMLHQESLSLLYLFAPGAVVSWKWGLTSEAQPSPWRWA